MTSEKLRRIGLRLLQGLGIAVAAIALLVGIVFVVLKTDWGGERIRRQVVKSANQQILGQLGIGKLSFGGNRLLLRNITLRDPDGELVAKIARVEVAFRIGALLHKELRITSVEIDDPVITAESDERGSNIARATAPRTKSPEKPPAPKTTKEGWVVQLERFNLNRGDVKVTNAQGTKRKDVVHLANLDVFLKVRYATGNGSLDLNTKLNTQNTSVPAGPVEVLADAHVRGSAIKFSIDATLISGRIKGQGDLDTEHLEGADVVVVGNVPRQTIAGFAWGPSHLDVQAHPRTVPIVDFLLAVPGVELTAKGGQAPGKDNPTSPSSAFQLAVRLAVADLGLTGKAVQALSLGEIPALSGEGHLDLTVAGPMARAPAGWHAAVKGDFPRLRVTETVIAALSIDGQAAELAAVPREAELHIGIASVTAGTTVVRKAQLDAQLRQQNVSLKLGIVSPQPIEFALTGRVDDDRAGLALTQTTLRYPDANWTSDGVARLRFEPEKQSLKSFRLHADTQQLAVDGAKEGEQFDAHLALSHFRLDLLPEIAVSRELNLGGTLDLDVKGAGRTSNPKVDVKLQVAAARVRQVSKIDATLDASLADQRVKGKLGVEAPIAALSAHFDMPIDPLQPRAALDLGLDVSRLDLSDALRAAAKKPQVDGRLTVHLDVNGSADDPKVDLVLTARDLAVKPPVKPSEAATKTVNVGHGRVHVTYGERALRGDVDFSFAQGGTLHVESIARVDLSYPRVTQGLVVKKMPIHGKVLAKDLEVAWLSQFNDQMQTVGGQVSADAQLAGTVGDPQFIGDVRWKNGKLVTVPPASKSKHPPARARRP